MSAQRRTAGKRETAMRERQPSNGGGPMVAATATAPAPSSRPPKPVVVERGREEPKSGFATRLDDIKGNYRDTVAELRKVNWPDRETTKNLTIVVIAISIALGLVLGGIDFLFQTLFSAVP